MTIYEFILELMKLGMAFGFERTVQLGGAYGSCTQNFYFEEATAEADGVNRIVNIPSDLCSG